jgi:hypothetical protein
VNYDWPPVDDLSNAVRAVVSNALFYMNGALVKYVPVGLRSNEGGPPSFTSLTAVGGDVVCAKGLHPSVTPSTSLFSSPSASASISRSPSASPPLPSASPSISPSASASAVPIEAVYRGVLLKKVALNDLARTPENALAVCNAIGFSVLCNQGSSDYYHETCLQLNPLGDPTYFE